MFKIEAASYEAARQYLQAEWTADNARCFVERIDDGETIDGIASSINIEARQHGILLQHWAVARCVAKIIKLAR